MHASVRPAVSVNIPPTGTNTAARESAAALAMRMTVSKVNFFYGSKQTLFDISMGIATNKVTALIGPSGCGKSTLLRTLNRMHETVKNARLEGEILLDGKNILAQDVTSLRRRVGMVFQRPNPFPKSIFDNVAYGPRVNGSEAPISETVEKSLRHAALWDEVKDQLHKSAYELSGGQQQRQNRRAARSAEGPHHYRHRHSQHAAGCARQRFHGVSPGWPTRRIQPYAATVYNAERSPDGGLYHWPLRLIFLSPQVFSLAVRDFRFLSCCPDLRGSAGFGFRSFSPGYLGEGPHGTPFRKRSERSQRAPALDGQPCRARGSSSRPLRSGFRRAACQAGPRRGGRHQRTPAGNR